MKKYVRFVPWQEIRSVDGSRVVGRVTHREVLLDATTMPEFLEGKVGMTALQFIEDAKAALSPAAEHEAEEKGWWAFEEEVARGFRNAFEKGRWNQARAAAILPFGNVASELLASPPKKKAR